MSRGLPAPVIDGAAVRVDTGLPAETRRYIFPAATPAISALAATICQPGIVIKLLAPLPDLLALVPGWRVHPQSFFMACDAPMRGPVRPLPDDYTLTLTADGPIIDARVTTADGTVAARGRAVAHAGLFVFDRSGPRPTISAAGSAATSCARWRPARRRATARY